ncbi:MAG: polyphosphate kinase 1 [Bacteroidetes bacterium]|nr:polyphosphate kinase 1 [Bacteroidota bacterium]
MVPTQKYINRDLSWLSFNNRVLEEAKDKSVPLYERLRFLAIYSSNLDEFFKVRVASYRRQLNQFDENTGERRSDPEKILKDVLSIVNKQLNEFGRIFWKELVPELKSNNIILLQDEDLQKSHKEFITNFFYEQVIPYLQPVLLIKGKISPFLQDDVIYMAIKLFKKLLKKDDIKKKRKRRYAIVNVPTDKLPRFIELPEANGKHYIMFLDDIIRHNLDALFPGYEISSSYCIKLSRDADLGIDDEFTGDLIEKISKSLVKRKTGVPSRFLFDNNIPGDFLTLLKGTFKLSKKDLVPGGKYHNFSDLFSFPNPLSPDLENEFLPPLYNRDLEQYSSMLEAITERDWMLHFPYHSYDPVIRFLNEAAIDPKVKEIKTTQYRVAADSSVINALINAVRNGKKVTVFVEVKARFDEHANLHFAKLMKKSGIKIIYSIPGLKVHAKGTLILRKPGKNKKDAYAFLSTGNFNEKTAKIYADHGLFTSNENITGELKNLFKYLENQDNQFDFKYLLIAQFNIKDELTRKIDREIDNAEKGKPAWIILKMNGLDNKKMIDKLYEASQKGVKINLIVRGICCLIPGKQFSKNITITRIVDRFLEHARVFIFNNDDQNEIYMASADWMNRNLNRRIELGFPVLDEDIKKEVMEILRLQLSDNTKARVLDSKHNNIIKSTNNNTKIRAQIETYNLLQK